MSMTICQARNQRVRSTLPRPSAVSTGLVMHAVNDMSNVTEKRRAAQASHVPETVLHLLLTVTLDALGFLAYGYALTGQLCHG